MDKVVLDLLLELTDDEVVLENLDIELFDTGLIDSLAFTELLVGLEDKLNVVISPSEIDRSEMDTPRKIIAQVAARI
ncbi:MAG: D-alanine--poly(phosphoribitol) ligase subunit DltC [Coriobacteriaceae bacterium]|nr:D-alanine--poly(phosphoribitol) ligase subunit DltC [Coriobacteriaceae bacterium]